MENAPTADKPSEETLHDCELELPAASTADVALCVFNSEDTIRRCLDSVLQQNELGTLFVLDDGSTDGTAAILQEFSFNPKVVVISKQSNKGLANGLNEILNISTARYIARIDADDVMLEDRLKRQLQALREQPEIAVLGSNAILEKSGGATTLTNVPTKHNEIVRQLALKNPMLHPSVIFDRQKILALGGYDVRAARGQDVLLWDKSAAHGLKFANLPEALIVRKADGNRSLQSLRQELRTNLRRGVLRRSLVLSAYSIAIFCYQVVQSYFRK